MLHPASFTPQIKRPLIPPPSKVFNVQIAHTQYGRGLAPNDAKLRPELQQRFRKWCGRRKGGFPLVTWCLRAEILAIDRSCPANQLLGIGRCFEDIHAGADRFRDHYMWRRFECDRPGRRRSLNRNFAASSATCFAHALLDLGIAEFERISAIQAPICSISDRGMPARGDEAAQADRHPSFVWQGIERNLNFLLTRVPARSRLFRRPFP